MQGFKCCFPRRYGVWFVKCALEQDSAPAGNKEQGPNMEKRMPFFHIPGNSRSFLGHL